MSFFCPSPVCLERERQYYRREKKKKREREIGKEKKRNDFRDKLKNRGQIFGAIPFQPYNNRKNGQFVYNFSNANLNSKLNKNWFLGVFPPNT
jgi:hypothetical protein